MFNFKIYAIGADNKGMNLEFSLDSCFMRLICIEYILHKMCDELLPSDYYQALSRQSLN